MYQIWIPVTYCILCVLRKCRVPMHDVRPKLCAVQQICPPNLPRLPHLIIPPMLRVPSVAFLYNCVVKGFSAPLINPFCLNFNKKPFATQALCTQHTDRTIGSTILLQGNLMLQHLMVLLFCSIVLSIQMRCAYALTPSILSVQWSSQYMAGW